MRFHFLLLLQWVLVDNGGEVVNLPSNTRIEFVKLWLKFSNVDTSTEEELTSMSFSLNFSDIWFSFLKDGKCGKNDPLLTPWEFGIVKEEEDSGDPIK